MQGSTPQGSAARGDAGQRRSNSQRSSGGVSRGGRRSEEPSGSYRTQLEESAYDSISEALEDGMSSGEIHGAACRGGERAHAQGRLMIGRAVFLAPTPEAALSAAREFAAQTGGISDPIGRIEVLAHLCTEEKLPLAGQAAEQALAAAASEIGLGELTRQVCRRALLKRGVPEAALARLQAHALPSIHGGFEGIGN